MMLRSLAVAALTVAGSGVACAQSVYLYVAPGASVYVTPTPNGYYNGAPTVYEGAYPGPPIVAAPRSPATPAPRSSRRLTWHLRPPMRRGMAYPCRPMARRPVSSCSAASMSRSRCGRRLPCHMAGGRGGRTLDALVPFMPQRA